MLAFLLKAITISLTGVMAPGAMTAATIAHGSKDPKAGLIVSLGHGIIELPLIVLLVFGIGKIIQSETAQIIIGIVGGLFLVYIAATMLIDSRKPISDTNKNTGKPLISGIVLTAGNPYFLLWWATVGILLAIDAKKLGLLAFILFAITHWLCDVIWLSILSFASFKGTSLMGPKVQKGVLLTCGLILMAFAIKFILDAAMLCKHTLQ